MRTAVILLSTIFLSMIPASAATSPSTIGCAATPLQNFGAPVTLSASVTAATMNPLMPTIPTGTVSFTEGNNLVGGAFLNGNGYAQTTITSLSIGFHVLTCTYSGDANFAPSSGTTSVTIAQGTTMVTITASQNPVPPNTAVTFVVQVSAPGGQPTGGALTIYDGTTVLFTGSILYQDGSLVFTANNLAPGTHNITATYGGDSMFSPGTTARPLVLVINRNPSKTTLTTSASQVAFGQTLTATVQVSGTTGGTPTGTVTITDNGITVGTGTLASGSATITVSALSPGTHNLIANYGGDPTFDVSSSGTVAETVSPGQLQVVSSASGGTTISADSLVSLFGTALAPAAGSTTAVVVTFKDSAGNSQTASQLYTSPGQINVVAPANLAAGTATVTVMNGTTVVAMGTVTVATIAPAIFTADGTANGVAAAVVETVHADGTITTSDVFQCSKNVCVTVPINLGSSTDQVALVLFGTGIRHAQQQVLVKIGSQTLTPAYAGAQPSFPGLDQVNVLLPQSLKGAGNTTVTLVIGSQSSNSAALQIQ